MVIEDVWIEGRIWVGKGGVRNGPCGVFSEAENCRCAQVLR